MKNCNNCHANVEGKYCSQCGQQASIGRLHTHDLLHELWHAFTHADKGIIKLLTDLVVHPASVYKRYYSGQRKFYFSPMLFYILTAGLSIFIGDEIFKYENHVNHMNNEFGQFVLDHTKLLGLFLLPVETLLTWLFFHRRYNLAENAVFWLFCNGLVFSFRVVVAPIYFLFIDHKHILDYIFGMAGFLIMYWQMAALFAFRNSWKAYIFCFILINLIIILYQYAGYYLLFDDEAFHRSFWDMLKAAYLG